MGNAGLAPLQASKLKADPARVPAMKPHRSAATPSIQNFLSGAGNMAIQRAASGPLAGNPAAGAVLGGANMSGGCTCTTGTCEECKKKTVQRKGERELPVVASGFHSNLHESGSGEPLSPQTRSKMERSFGESFSDVKIHHDVSANRAAHSISAHAFTVGHDIYFGSSRYEPESTSGQKLLAHELAHVLQQTAGAVLPQPSSIDGSTSLPIDTSGEANAEQAAEKVAAGKPVGAINSHKLSIQGFIPEAIGENVGDLGKLGEFGKLGELGKSAPPEIAEPVANPTPGATPQSGAQPSPFPGPFPGPFPIVGPLPQTGEDDERTKDPRCGTKELPLTMVTFFPGPLGQGGRVKASPLTKCPGNTQGSMPDPSIYRQQFDCINAAGQSGTWVRAHILHGETSSSGPFNLHGPGNDIRNLIISDKSINGLMSSRAERPVIQSIYGDNTVLWYDSKVDSYEPGKEYFAQSITVTVGSYDTNTNTEGPAIPGIGGTFRLKQTNVPPNCPPSPGGGTPATPGPSGSLQGVTPPVAPGAIAGTPSTSLEFTSTLKICKKELASREFKIKNGGLEVRIFAEWFDEEGLKALDASACPIDHYFVVLEQAGLLWGFNQYSQKPIQIPVGQRILPLKWTGLQDDTYRLKIYVEDEHPSCCLQGNITVSTFFAPAGGPVA